MYTDLKANNRSIQYINEYPGGIKFLSLATDPLVANGRRAEKSSRYKFPLDSERALEWRTIIPNDWVEDEKWCVITQAHTANAGPQPVFAIELVRDQMIVKIRDDDKQHYAYESKMLKGELLHFKMAVRFTEGRNGTLELKLNGVPIVDYSGRTYYSGHDVGPYFTFGLYMHPETKAFKRTITHFI